jgi:hypothetical protein
MLSQSTHCHEARTLELNDTFHRVEQDGLLAVSQVYEGALRGDSDIRRVKVLNHVFQAQAQTPSLHTNA